MINEIFIMNFKADKVYLLELERDKLMIYIKLIIILKLKKNKI
jgi:hypothetical protein